MTVPSVTKRKMDMPDQLRPIVMPTSGGSKRVGYEVVAGAVVVDGEEYILSAKDIPTLAKLWKVLGLTFEPLRTRECAVLNEDYYRQITGRAK